MANSAYHKSYFRRLVGLLVSLSFLVSSAHGQASTKFDKVISEMKPYVGEHIAGVDTTTLKGKVMCGYQGWFAAKGDGAELGWKHYTGRQGLKPGSCTFDIWPDMSELDEDEKFTTPFKYSNGKPAKLFSSYHRKTVVRHFKWMEKYGISGVFLQRFGSSLKSPKNYRHRNVVTANVQAGANQHGRTWAMMYDLSGLQAGDIEKYVIADWKRLIDRMKITKDKSYLHHKGKPVIAVWGIGFKDGRKYSLDECEKLVKFLKNDPIYGGNTVMLGVPTGWRSLHRDAVDDKKLHEIIKLADIVSPWTVGRYNSPQAARKHAEKVIKPDLEWTNKNQLDYIPVAFPGFSWQNLKKNHGEESKLNKIPRLKGEFLWSQVTSFKQAGADTLYIAMFDEIDEATAIFKCTNTPPMGKSKFLTNEDLPSDHYLWLTGKAGALMRGESKMSPVIPKRP